MQCWSRPRWKRGGRTRSGFILPISDIRWSAIRYTAAAGAGGGVPPAGGGGVPPVGGGSRGGGGVLSSGCWEALRELSRQLELIERVAELACQAPWWRIRAQLDKVQATEFFSINTDFRAPFLYNSQKPAFSKCF